MEGFEGYQKDFGFYLKGVGDCSWFSALKWERGKHRGMRQEDPRLGPETGKEGTECE